MTQGPYYQLQLCLAASTKLIQAFSCRNSDIRDVIIPFHVLFDGNTLNFGCTDLLKLQAIILQKAHWCIKWRKPLKTCLKLFSLDCCSLNFDRFVSSFFTMLFLFVCCSITLNSYFFVTHSFFYFDVCFSLVFVFLV